MPVEDTEASSGSERRELPGSPFRSRDYRRLFGAAVTSNFGSMLHAMALPFVAITALDATPKDMALLGAAGLLPGFLLGLFAATWIDRLERKPIMIAADLARSALVAWIPISAMLGLLDFVQLYGIVMLLGLLGFSFDVARHSMLPDVVARRQLVDANGKIVSGEAVSEGLGFAAGGWLIELLTPARVLFIDAGSFILSALFLTRLRTRRAAPAAVADDGASSTRSVLAEMREGLRFLIADRALLACAAGGALIGLGWRIAGVVYLLFVYEELGFEPGVLGLVFASGGIASAFAGALSARISRRLGRRTTMVMGAALFGASILVLPLAPGAGLIGLVIVVANQLGDGFEVLFDVNQASLRQEVTPSLLLGRVAGTSHVLGSGAMLLGLGIGGVLGEMVGLRATLLVAACAPLVGALWLAIGLRGYEVQPPREASGASE